MKTKTEKMEDQQEALLINQKIVEKRFSMTRKKISGEKKLKIKSQEVPAYSIELRCPGCQKKIQSKLEKIRSMKKTVFAGTTLLLFGGLAFVFFPFIINDIQDIQHSCPECEFKIGMYKPLNTIFGTI